MTTFDAVGPSSSGSTTLVSPNQFNVTCAAGDTELLVGVAVDVPSNDVPVAVSVTYNGVSMTSYKRWESGGSTASVGFLQIFRLANPPTGSSLQVSITVTAGGSSFDVVSAGSLSFAGSSGLGTAVTADSNGTSATSGTITVATSSASNLVAAFVACGSDSIAFTAGTSRFVTTGIGSGAAGACAGATIAGTGGNVSVSWTQASDFYGAIAIEVLNASGAVQTQDPVYTAPSPAAVQAANW